MTRRLLVVIGLQLLTVCVVFSVRSAPDPNTLSATNLIAADMGGVIESITSECGPGSTGNQLIDGKRETIWKAKSPIAFPQELVFSFYHRQPALASSVVVTLSGNLPAAPKEVEVWISEAGPDTGFKRVAAQTLNQTAPDQTISFPPINARFVKLAILSTNQPGALEIADVQVIEEAGARGYKALLSLNPAMAAWKQSPRSDAQRGVEWLESSAIDWQKQHDCFGCHTQAQTIMGLSVAKKNDYVVSDRCLKDLVTFTERAQHPGGDFHTIAHITATQFASMGLASFDDTFSTNSPALIKSVNWLLDQQKSDGELPADHDEPPIDQGSIMTSTNAVVSFTQAFRETNELRYKEAADRAFTWVTSAKPETTQDKVFKILALSWFGNEAQRAAAKLLVDQLKTEQKSDGGWQERNDSRGSNAFATGQVLYAFKQAGVNIDSPEFARGVQYLLATQRDTGAWVSLNSQSDRPSDFAPTMWAVIGLAGSFHASGEIRVVLDSAVLFDFNRYNLKPEAETALTEIKASVLDKHQGAKLIVEGHTDNVAGEAYNLTLSQRRARSVADWLERHGIKRSLIEVKGFGKSQPKVPNTSDENRARNRRVEIVVIEK